ncbi:MAG TPA: hypothetical protein DCS07_04860 [Bdellovibrionales bacterium]|nr:MAG: hypothetical protein A2Z97_10555 [Bdellovibrionales bacterium GWB1_52_6]OFZ02527.1 MAG: hypothetical protein A2X97_07650 [Bdellovibrionales bacterium GWA1_52_35]OFZ36610.1 MAG: hypothetical protein A2070_00060 [Bdellovibrionales bacterium GWC1_52_8]HAR41950.1 hypothetical protein [Bdellovibrionales bacterium]HCM41373.1 hypothetical protein [Bdellovibrionales bacterium]
MADKNAEHGPENAEHEIRKAYNLVIESGLTFSWDRRPIPWVNPDEVSTLYKIAYQAFRNGERLASERWARTAKHLARAFWHEAKISYLEPRATDLPFLQGASSEEYNLHEHSDTTEDLIESVAGHVPPGMTQMPDQMQRYISRARKHLQVLGQPYYENELLRAERIKAAHEYGRVLECMALAYEAEAARKKKAA